MKFKDIIKDILIIFFFIGFIYFAIKDYKNSKSYIPQMSRNVNLDSSFNIDYTKTYHDSEGNQHIVIDNKSNAIIESEASKFQPAISSIAESLGVKEKQIEGSITISTRISEDSILALKHTIDSLRHTEKYDYKDKNLTLSFTKDSADRGIFGFGYDADLNINQYWLRNKVNVLGIKLPIGSKGSYTDISSNDPRVSIKGVKKFTVKQREPAYGLNLGLTTSYSDNTKAFSVGPFARFYLDRLKGSIKGSYLYNTQTKTTGWSASFDKDLIRF